MADGRQRRLAVELLDRRGYPVRVVADAHRAFGATDGDIGTSVETWVEGLDQRSVSSLLDKLITGDVSNDGA